MSFSSISPSLSLSAPNRDGRHVRASWATGSDRRRAGRTKVLAARYCDGAERDDVDRHAGDDVVDAEDHRGDGVQQAAEHAHEDRAERRRPRRRSGSRSTPPPQVPRIIMPSRPMLTTPARSDQRPPRPASMIGMVAIEGRGDGARRGEVVGAGDHAQHGQSSRTPATPAYSTIQQRGSRRFGRGADGLRDPGDGGGDAHAGTSSTSGVALQGSSARRPCCSSRTP